MTTSSELIARREAARMATGEFGEHTRSAPELTLGSGAWPDDLGGTQYPGQWGEISVDVGASTPWGYAQYPERVAEGIVFVPTDSHGGYKLSAERNAAIPAPYRSRNRWYDEDDGRMFVELYHYDATSRRNLSPGPERDAHLESIDQSIRDREPDAWEKVNKRVLEPGESRVKDERAWGEANSDEYVATSQQKSKDGFVLVTARRESTGDEDTFLLSAAERDEAIAAARVEFGAGYRFRVPAGTVARPRPKAPDPVAGFTDVPSTDGLSTAAAKKVTDDLNKRWRMRGTGQVMSLRQQIEAGHITSKSVYVSDLGVRTYHLEDDNASTSMKVSKAMFDAFSAPDTRTAKDILRESYSIAKAKYEKLQRAADASFRVTPMLHAEIRAAATASNIALEKYRQAPSE